MVYLFKLVVLFGSNGLIEGVLVEIEQVLEYYEFIKVKIVIEDCEIKILIVEVIVCEIGVCNV